MNFLAQVLELKSTTYADDMAVLLIDYSKPHVLLDILALYSQTSSARLNRHKALAGLLSGRPQHSWQYVLSSHRITQWHDRSNSITATCLGYSLISTGHQLSSFLASPLLKLQQHAQMLVQRNLLILGCSLVTNTPLPSPNALLTMNKIDYKIDWQTFEIRMVNKLLLTQVCPFLLMPNQNFKTSYWSGIFVKHVHEFNMTRNKFRPLPLPALTDSILDSLLPDETPSLNTKWFREFQLPHSSKSPTS
ncbi:hypothetical protein G6F43_007057 [Rhizopus delemar]|nr:hypothetical protein G6F43_007057 [Rhizopus delemar]